MQKSSLFTRFARWGASAAGRPIAFLLAVGVIIVWAVSGPLFAFGDTWQLVINTSTTIVTCGGGAARGPGARRHDGRRDARCGWPAG